jgi:hypothetical protein
MAKRRHVFLSFHHDDVGKVRGLNLLSRAPNVDLSFSGRHLINPVKSEDRAYILRSIGKQITGSSVTALIVGGKTAQSDWIAEEVGLSNEKDPPNGFVVIKLTPDAELPDGIPDYAQVVEWNGPEDLDTIGEAIEHAAAGREKIPAMQAATPGLGSNCDRAA